MAARHDPREGVTSDGLIVTGADRGRVPEAYESVLDSAIEAVRIVDAGSSLYVYGSVANGTAEVPRSDVDLVSIGLPAPVTREMADDLSSRFSGLCRSVSIGAGQPDDHQGDDWEAYGNRVFLRHYCVHLAGPDHRATLPDFPADAAAARGFNGDLARHVAAWRADLADHADPGVLARRIGRKTLFALAGLVSVRDAIWTTDRAFAASRWAQVHPDLAHDLEVLLEWSEQTVAPDGDEIAALLDGAVPTIATIFATEIGLWDD